VTLSDFRHSVKLRPPGIVLLLLCAMYFLLLLHGSLPAV